MGDDDSFDVRLIIVKLIGLSIVHEWGVGEDDHQDVRMATNEH